jgi:hypothetical protein
LAFYRPCCHCSRLYFGTQTTIFFFIKKKVSLLIALTALVFVSVLLALAHKGSQLTNSLSLGAVLASWATVIGVVGALIAAFSALKTYKSNNSIAKWKLIEKIYNDFLKGEKEGDWYNFYKKIQNGEQIHLEEPKEEKLLNETLTLFDALGLLPNTGVIR